MTLWKLLPTSTRAHSRDLLPATQAVEVEPEVKQAVMSMIRTPPIWTKYMLLPVPRYRHTRTEQPAELTTSGELDAWPAGRLKLETQFDPTPHTPLVTGSTRYTEP